MNTSTTAGIDSESDQQRIRAIRRERAVRLAQPRTSPSATSESSAVLMFKMSDETYGIELQRIAGVHRQRRITPVPGATSALSGIVNLDGAVRSVLDLRSLLSLPDPGVEVEGYVLLVRSTGGLVGLRVEQLIEVRHVARADVTATEPTANDGMTVHARGITHDKIILLNLETLLAPTAHDATDANLAEHRPDPDARKP